MVVLQALLLWPGVILKVERLGLRWVTRKDKLDLARSSVIRIVGSRLATAGEDESGKVRGLLEWDGQRRDAGRWIAEPSRTRILVDRVP